MAFCPNCSSPTSGRFCTNCGFNIAQSPSQSYQYPTLRPFPYVAIAAIVFAIISIIMIILAGAFTWWEMDISTDFDVSGEDVTVDTHLEFTLEESSYEVQYMDEVLPDKNNEENLKGDAEDVCDCTALILLLGAILMIIACIFVILMIGASRTFTMTRHTRAFKILGILFALLALIVILIAPLYYAGAWSDEVKNEFKDIDTEVPGLTEVYEDNYDDSFSGSESFSDTIGYSYYYEIDVTGESKWGPGLGWILSFLCIVFILITLILIKVGGDQAQRMAVTTPLPPQYGFGYQQPQIYQPPQPYPQPTPQPYPQPTPQPYPQPLPLPQRPSSLPTKVTCPTCGSVIPVHARSLPHPITCPQCGTRGFVE
jgi:hypothetical protein